MRINVQAVKKYEESKESEQKYFKWDIRNSLSYV